MDLTNRISRAEIAEQLGVQTQTIATGGTFALEQTRIGDGRWAIKRLTVNFSGRVLLVRSLRIDWTLTTRGYRRMPNGLTLTQGFDLLKEHENDKE
jgi:hypothetical protein